jgi:hypothetical protein
MLGLSWTIAIVAYIMTDEFATVGKEDALLQRERYVHRPTHFELTTQVGEERVKGRRPAENIVYDDASVGPSVDNNTARASKLLPSMVEIMNHEIKITGPLTMPNGMTR